MTKYRIDYLKNHIDYKVCQGNDMYHFNSDTCFLGEYISINDKESVLDVGTNNAALLVYAFHKCETAKLTGLDINKKALKYAKKTLRLNKIKAKLICKDFSSFQSKRKYDVIISNPPYFDSKDEKEKNLNENIKIARHEHYLTLESLIKSCKNNLCKEGRIYLVHRPNRLKDIQKAVKENNLMIKDVKEIINEKNKLITILVTIVNA